MNKHLITFALIPLLTGCIPTPTVAPSSPATNPNSPNTISVTEVTPTTDIQPISTLTGSPEPSGTLWLQILAPLDEAVVNTSEVDVIGSAPAGSVISVNDEILIVGADLHFTVPVTLEEGPNLIEIIASDENGNELSVLLTVTYEP